jgi:hypothetical protein
MCGIGSISKGEDLRFLISDFALVLNSKRP